MKLPAKIAHCKFAALIDFLSLLKRTYAKVSYIKIPAYSYVQAGIFYSYRVSFEV